MGLEINGKTDGTNKIQNFKFNLLGTISVGTILVHKVMQEAIRVSFDTKSPVPRTPNSEDLDLES
jgi:hypothetical protein